MAVSIELDNDELGVLYFYIQKNTRSTDDPLIEKVSMKLETLIFSRFSIDEIEKYKNKVMNTTFTGESS